MYERFFTTSNWLALDFLFRKFVMYRHPFTIVVKGFFIVK